MPLDKLAGDGETQPRPVGTPRTRKGLEDPVPGALGQSWPIVSQGDDIALALAPPTRADHARPGRGHHLDGLAGIAHQVDQDAVQLVGVGLDLDAGLDLADEEDALRPIGEPALLGGGGQGVGQDDGNKAWRRLLGLAVGKDVAGQAHGAIEGPLEARQGLGDPGVRHGGQPLRGHLGAGQHVAQVVVDLGHRLAQGGQAGPGGQGHAQVGLHPVELDLGAADLVPPPRGLEVGGRVVGVGPEPLHGPGNPLHGPDQEEVQRQEDQGAGEAGDEQGREDHLPEIGLELVLQGGVGRHHLDEFGLFPETGLGHHPDGPVVSRAEGQEGGDQPGADRLLPKVHEIGCLVAPGPLQHQATKTPGLYGHRLYPGTGQELGGELLGDHPVRRDFGGQGGQFGSPDPVQQPVALEGRQGGGQDEGAGQGHEEGGEHKKARGQAAWPEQSPAGSTPSGLCGGGFWRLDLGHGHSSRGKPACGQRAPLDPVVGQEAPTASARERNPSARRRAARSRERRTARPGPSKTRAEYSWTAEAPARMRA